MKIFKYVSIILLVLFFCLFFANSAGYYEYKLSQKTNLTDEAIKQFEQDIKDGKEVDVNDYIDDKTKNYDNNLTKINKKVSESISKVFGGSLKYFFKYISNAVNE